ncbi:MAG: DNA polymerase/3'-5' exonuclease PolX [Planctomycetes bacterium]|nr:DNA polymerase/3'-5' exonuclease PolX [Planctomycetota bacterium]
MSSTQHNEELAAIFEEMAALLDILGENPFKVRSYHNVSHIFSTLDGDAAELLASGQLENVKGVGSSTIEKVREYLETGRIAAHLEIRSRLPADILDLLQVPGFGPRKARAVYQKLGVSSLHQLEEAAASGKLEELEGFGRKTEENILAGIELVKKHKGRFLWADAMHVIEPVLNALSSHKSVITFEVAGSLRRYMETVKDADILAATSDPASTSASFLDAAAPVKITSRGDTKVSIVTSYGMAVDLRMVSKKEFPYALHHFTGSKEHNIAMRGRSQKMGFKMNEYGLFRVSRAGRETPVKCASENDLFQTLGLDYIPPELREDAGEIEAAEHHVLPHLVRREDVRGAIHVHSTYSDGHDSIEDMAVAARDAGFSYILISDHSQSAYYAGGLKPDELKKQWKEIDALNRRLDGVRILKGIETDILADGSVDYSDGILERFDCVIASIHSGFTHDEATQTMRLVRAARNRHVDVIGHLSGRLLLQREGYPVNHEEVLKACADTGTAVEINGNPHRLDLDWRWARRARELGVRTVLTSDAHRKETLSHVFAAVGVARKAWLEKKDVLNSRGADGFIAALKNGS